MRLIFFFIGRRRHSEGPLGVCAWWRHRAPRVSRSDGDAITLPFQTMLRKKPRWRFRLKWRPKFSARLAQESSHRRPASFLPADSVLSEEMSSPPKEKMETKGGHAPAGKRSFAPSALFSQILRMHDSVKNHVTALANSSNRCIFLTSCVGLSLHFFISCILCASLNARLINDARLGGFQRLCFGCAALTWTS